MMPCPVISHCHSRPSEARGREPRGLGTVSSPLGSLPSQRYALLAGNDKRRKGTHLGYFKSEVVAELRLGGAGGAVVGAGLVVLRAHRQLQLPFVERDAEAGFGEGHDTRRRRPP